MVDAPQLESGPVLPVLPAMVCLPRRRTRASQPGPGRHRHRIGRNPARTLRPYHPRNNEPTKGWIDMASARCAGRDAHDGRRRRTRRRHGSQRRRPNGSRWLDGGESPGRRGPACLASGRCRGSLRWWHGRRGGRTRPGPGGARRDRRRRRRPAPRRSRSRPPRWPGVGTVLTTALGPDAVPLHRGQAGRRRRARGACAKIWPPLLASKGAHVSGPKGVKGLSLINVGNGHWQVAFHKVPLYRFEGDKKKGQAHGQKVGNVWFAVHEERHPGLDAAPASATTPTTAAPSTPTTPTARRRRPTTHELRTRARRLRRSRRPRRPRRRLRQRRLRPHRPRRRRRPPAAHHADDAAGGGGYGY